MSLDKQKTELKKYRKYCEPDVYTQQYFNKGLPYGHYKEKRLSISVPRRKTIEQVSAAHEFGHLIGLADEYVIPKEV